MSHTVYANDNAVACKAGDVKVIAAFPDVCKSPPGPPTGPLPVPYAASSFAQDLHAGSKSVKIGGQPIALKNQSYFKSSPLGNEAATKGFGAGIASQQMGGKTYFAMWSMNVRAEGANVCRHTDIATSNHGSNANTPPMAALDKATIPAASEAEQKPKCECCGEEMHKGQLGPDDKPGPVVSEEDWYMIGPEETAYIYDALDVLCDNPPNPGNKRAVRHENQAVDRLARLESQMVDRRKAIAKGRAAGCPSLPEPPCNVYRVLPVGTSAEIEAVWVQARDQYLKDRGLEGGQTNHRVPKAAGGCPGSSRADGNLVHNSALSAECLKFEARLTEIQGEVCKERNKRSERGVQ
jgi:hypothetical protein